MKTQFLIITILLSLSTPALCSHDDGNFRRIARQDQPDLDSAALDEADEVSVLDMAEVRIQMFSLYIFDKYVFIRICSKWDSSLFSVTLSMAS